jgi:hypothetical protein
VVGVADSVHVAGNIDTTREIGRREVLKKFIGAVVAAGALSIPLAGVVCGDSPADPGSNGHGVGAGGIPRVIGDNLGSTDPIPPGSVISDVAQQAGVSVPDAISALFPDTDRTPGGAVKRQTPGCGNGNGPKHTDFSSCP